MQLNLKFRIGLHMSLPTFIGIIIKVDFFLSEMKNIIDLVKTDWGPE